MFHFSAVFPADDAYYITTSETSYDSLCYYNGYYWILF